MRPPQQPADEKPLDKLITLQLRKAGLTVCLFLFIIKLAAQPEGWLTKPAEQEAFRMALNLELAEVRTEFQNLNNPQALYLTSLTEILELLITEDESLFDKYENAYEKRLQSISKITPKTPEALYISAELRLQWAFVYLKFQHEFDAAWNIRQSYLLAQECLNRFPVFTPAKKTYGLLNIMLGSVPDKYQWVLSVLGMRGSVDKGLEDLRLIQASDNPTLATEASLILYLAQGLILQQPQLALQELSAWPMDRHTRLSLFLAAVLAIKNSESEKALSYLDALSLQQEGISISYADYLKGEVYLHKGDYPTAIASYKNFLQTYSGKNFVKDALYKMAICYWLPGDKSNAEVYARRARTSGLEYAEADRYAARSLAENELPNPKLTKIRYATDGGYYETATRIIESVKDEDLPGLKDRTEFTYRKARLYHKLDDSENSKKFYLQTINLAGTNPWYFAPNACLQLGYLYMAEGDSKRAASYFRKALEYKKHEYKNSIDSKARSALGQLQTEK